MVLISFWFACARGASGVAFCDAGRVVFLRTVFDIISRRQKQLALSIYAYIYIYMYVYAGGILVLSRSARCQVL